MRKILTYDFFEICRANKIGQPGSYAGLDGIRLSSYEALIFSEVTGAIYVDSGIHGFSYKGLSKIFHSALRNDFVTGLYDKGQPYFTPLNLKQRYPWLMGKDKIVIPVAFEDEEHFQEICHEIRNFDTEDSNVLAYRIEASKRGSGQENLLEYVVGNFMRRMGYVVESQAPLSHSLGTPDLIAIKSSALESHLNSLNLPYQGQFMIEFAMLADRQVRVEIADNFHAIDSDFDSIVFEAKVEKIDVTERLGKYLRSGFFNSSAQIKTDYEVDKMQNMFSFGFTEDWYLKSDFLQHRKTQVQNMALKEYDQWLIKQIDLYLLANFPSHIINEVSKGKFLHDPIKWLTSDAVYECLQALFEREGYGSI